MKNTSIFLLVALLSLDSCATLFSGKTQAINFMPTDSVEESEAEISNGKIRQTVKMPASILIPRSNTNLIISVKENDCYRSSQDIRESKMNMFTLLNIFGGWFSTSSTTTDSSTGALWSYDNSIMVNTQRKSSCRR